VGRGGDVAHFWQSVSFIFGQDFLRHEQETLKANASQIDQALQALDPVQCTLGPEWIRGVDGHGHFCL